MESKLKTVELVSILAAVASILASIGLATTMGSDEGNRLLASFLNTCVHVRRYVHTVAVKVKVLAICASFSQFVADGSDLCSSLES